MAQVKRIGIIKMWPFTSSRIVRHSPRFKVGECLVVWDPDFAHWEFDYREIEFSVSGEKPFDVLIFSKLDTALRWIEEQQEGIKSEIRKYLRDECPWNGELNSPSIDVSVLLDRNEIEAQFSGFPEWEDLGVFITITNGLVTSSCAVD